MIFVSMLLIICVCLTKIRIEESTLAFRIVAAIPFRGVAVIAYQLQYTLIHVRAVGYDIPVPHGHLHSPMPGSRHLFGHDLPLLFDKGRFQPVFPVG